jgi:hypothetical protein
MQTRRRFPRKGRRSRRDGHARERVQRTIVCERRFICLCASHRDRRDDVRSDAGSNERSVPAGSGLFVSPLDSCVLLRRRRARAFSANREYVHIQECPRVGGFECVPCIKIGERVRGRIALPKLLEDVRIELEAEKLKRVFVQERLDVWDGEPVLHDIEEHVAAAARAVEIDRFDERSPARRILFTDNGLA